MFLTSPQAIDLMRKTYELFCYIWGEQVAFALITQTLHRSAAEIFDDEDTIFASIRTNLEILFGERDDTEFCGRLDDTRQFPGENRSQRAKTRRARSSATR